MQPSYATKNSWFNKWVVGKGGANSELFYATVIFRNELATLKNPKKLADKRNISAPLCAGARHLKAPQD